MGTYISFPFVSASLFICVPYALFVLLERTAGRRISSRALYRIGNAKALLFLLPFLPCPSFLTSQGSRKIAALESGLSAGSGTSPSGTAVTAGAWMQDTVESAGTTVFFWIDRVLLLCWTAGVCFTLFCMIFSLRRLHALSKSCCPVTDSRTQLIFAESLRSSGLHLRVQLYTCSRVSSPLTYGMVRPRLLVPDRFSEDFSDEELRFIFLHELQHLKQKDQFLNPLLLLIRVLYWFHPCARLLLRSQRSQRELACDEAVICTLSRREQLSYANTLLRFAKSPGLSSPLVLGIGSKKSVLKKRILHISDYTPGGIRRKCRGILALALAFLLCLLSLPAISVRDSFAAAHPYDGSAAGEDYIPLDLSSYFHGVSGSFVLYDCNAGQYQIYNKELAQKRVSPDSVYKVCIALNALENGLITPEDSMLSWNGTEYPLSSWNQNHTLRSAMQNSVNWYFLDLDTRLGSERIAQALESYSYGNMDLSAGLSSYWLESSLKISPEEQTRFFKDFCEGTLPVSRKSLEAVRQSLLISADTDCSLYGKTGTGMRDGQNINGWFTGFVENADNTYCFALNLQGNEASGTLAAQTALNILNDMNIC